MSMLDCGAIPVHALTSPLAQVFQPLVVDDEAIPRDPKSGPSINTISYGPASRWQSSSIRLTPKAHGGESELPITSPLAQVFQPLIIND
jgi:hypothetical protein